MRALALPFEGPLDAYPFVAWTGSSLAALVDLDVARGLRAPFVVEGADVELLRAISAPFTVWARETLPLEDADGRIRPPGYPAH